MSLGTRTLAQSSSRLTFDRVRTLAHALLDWDGTISLLARGWVDIMVDLCAEHAPGVPREVIHAEMLRAQRQA
jgi:hypothetical protein